jgi:hypothetical protein
MKTSQVEKTQHLCKKKFKIDFVIISLWIQLIPHFEYFEYHYSVPNKVLTSKKC